MTPADDTPEENQPTLRLLQRMADGDEAAQEQLLPLVYDELHAIAGRLMARQDSSHTLQPTALVHEAWLKMVGVRDSEWGGREHFLRVAARAMRSVLVDHARARGAQRRDPGRRAVTLHEDQAMESIDLARVLAVHEGLEALAVIDGDLARLVELRFFGGLSNGEVAEVSGVSLRSVERGWQFARAWLQGHFGEEGEP